MKDISRLYISIYIAISRRYSADVMEHASPASLAGVITLLATTPEGPFAYFRIPPAILRPTYARHARWLRDANFTRAGQGLARGLPPSEVRLNGVRRNSRSTMRNFDNILDYFAIMETRRGQ